MSILPPLRLTGATLLRDGALQQRSIAIADGRITKGPLPEIDLSGYLVLPGIIDLHGDAFERHLAPRPTAPFPVETALAGTERDAAANGVTTAWIAQSWSWEGGFRSPDQAEDVMAALADYRRRAMIDMRLQVRCETHLPETRDRLLAAIRRYGIDYVIFNNHLPEALIEIDSGSHRLAGWAASDGLTVEQFVKKVRNAEARKRDVPRHLCALAEAFDMLGVAYGSHDDPDGETRDYYRLIGARIAEFPTTTAAAAVAKACNDPVLMGAPNVVRGGSQSGNVSATALIRKGLCDALVSDYHYPALAQAAWALVDKGIKTLPDAWAMISATPADIMGLADRGTLDYGRRADLVVVNETTRSVEATISAGRLAHLSGQAGARFMAAVAGTPASAPKPARPTLPVSGRRRIAAE